MAVSGRTLVVKDGGLVETVARRPNAQVRTGEEELSPCLSIDSDLLLFPFFVFFAWLFTFS